jgi:hypothetical protein
MISLKVSIGAKFILKHFCQGQPTDGIFYQLVDLPIIVGLIKLMTRVWQKEGQIN